MLRALFVAGSVMLASQALSSEPGNRFRGLSLEQALKTFEAQGIELLYSSALVKPWMHIRTEPSATEPHAALAEVLAPFRLEARAGPAGVVAIVRAAAPRSTEWRPKAAHVAATAVPLEEIIVTASRYELTRSLTPASVSLSGTDIEQLPDLGDDALRAIARLPGTATNGLGAQTHIRGGEADETLVRFDGIRLYNPFHLKDFQRLFSAIDPRIVSSVEVHTGALSAEFGDRLSGVIDIRSLQAPAPRYRELNASFFHTSALSSGLFREDRGEWVASVRRSNLDVWYHALSKEPGTPTYVDAFGKISYWLNDELRFTAGTLHFDDEISLSAEDRDERAAADYADRYYWLRLDHRPSPLLSGTTILSHAQLHSERTGWSDLEGVGGGRLHDRRAHRIETLQSDWSWHPSDRWLFRFGGELRDSAGSYEYEEEAEFALIVDAPGASMEPQRARSFHVEPHRHDYSAHASTRYGISPALTAEAGLRWESERAGPRLAVHYQLDDATSVRASWGRVFQSQSIDELQVADGISEFFAPQRTDHSSFSVERLLRNGVAVRVEAYDKRSSHLRPRYENLLNPLTLVPELRPDRVALTPTRARAHGVEVLLQRKRVGSLGWSLSYGWAEATESLGGVEVPRSWDQTHAFSALLDWSSSHWNVSIGVMHRSGWPTTAVFLEDAEELPILRTGSRNGRRGGTYDSVDLRAERKFMFQHSALSVFLEVANVFDRRNVCCTSYEIDDETAGLELESRHTLPRLPSLGFLWQF
jgi:outer membrane receptor protein involved in Fe transport